MASDPSEFGDEAAGDELRGVSFMLHRGPKSAFKEFRGGWRWTWTEIAMESDGKRQIRVRERITHASPSSMSASSSPPARAKSSSSISDMVKDVGDGRCRVFRDGDG